ncbi:MAG: metal ABC transporter substrate-binding protein, partial [Thermomicrobiales bacterium]
MKRTIGTFLLALLIGVGASSGQSTLSAEDSPVQVVSTFSILTDLIEQVGGDHVEVSTIVSSNTDAHNFAPSPEQVIQLTKADVIVENGVEFEPWLADMIEAAQPDAVLVVAADGIALRSIEEDGGTQEGESDHAHGAFDPHVWQDVTNAIIMVQNIRDGLIEADPDRSADYQANADAYIAELEALDAWIMAQVETLPAEQRLLVTSHDTIGYFAERYGFEMIGSPLSIAAEQAEPDAKSIADLIDIIDATGVTAIFTENIGNTGLMEQIAENAGVELAPP